VEAAIPEGPRRGVVLGEGQRTLFPPARGLRAL